MRDGTRAALSAALLAGFLATAWLQVLAVLLVVVGVLGLLPGSVAVQIAVPLAIATGGLLWFATVRALRLRYRPPAGVPVTRRDAPALWEMVDAAAGAAGVAAPDGVTVVAEATAMLAEQLRLGGLRGGRRDLLLGLPLLLAWDEARVRAVVAHELAHGSPRLGRFAPMARRGRLALARIVPRIPRHSPSGPLLRAYARWYRRVDQPFGRAQELAADQIAATFAGAHAAAAVLRDGPVLDGMQQLFHAEYVSPGWQAGYVPDDVFGGFLRVLAARAADAAALRAVEPEPPGEWDTHPPLAERLAALAPPGGQTPEPATSEGAAGQRAEHGAAQMAEQGAGLAAEQGAGLAAGQGAGLAAGQGAGLAAGQGAGLAAGEEAGLAAEPGAGLAAGQTAEQQAEHGTAADDLVPELPGLGRALQAVAFPPAGRSVVGWDEFFGVARVAEMEREADASLRALARVAGRPVTGATDVLDLAADGQLGKIAETVFAGLSAEETAERISDLITLLFALAALASGVARWRHSWTGTAELVAIDGSHLDLAGPAALAADPATVGPAREWLAELGIELTAAGAAGEHRPARVPVLGGVVNLQVDGARTDLLVVETGLVLVPGLPRSRYAEAKRRLARLAAEGVRVDGSLAGGQSAPVPDEAMVNAAATTSAGGPAVPAATADRAAAGGNRFVPFVEVATASVVRNGRRAWEIGLHDGQTLKVRAALDSDELPGGWAALDDAVAFLAQTR